MLFLNHFLVVDLGLRGRKFKEREVRASCEEQKVSNFCLFWIFKELLMVDFVFKII